MTSRCHSTKDNVFAGGMRYMIYVTVTLGLPSLIGPGHFSQ